MRRQLLRCFLLIILTSFATTLAEGPAIAKTIVVDKTGNGDFRTVQAAVDSVPPGNDRWIKIHIRSGIYKEKVDIWQDRGFVFLEGEGRETTSIETESRALRSRRLAPSLAGGRIRLGQRPDSLSLEDTAALSVLANNTIFKNLSIKNNDSKGRALAALINGDKASFYNCEFSSFQDTLCDMHGRHYFKGCFIEGAVDFIFGMGQSIYEGCTITIADGLSGTGWITAQGRMGAGDPDGFVFKSCTVTGATEAYLGRAWGPYSRVIFHKTFMPNIVHPQGWDSWNQRGRNFVYAESECSGPGANTTGRVRWEKELSAEDIATYTSIRFIDQEGWLAQQPQS